RFAPPYDLVQLRTPDGPLRARPDVGAPRRRPMTFAARGGDRHRGPVRRFVRAYGWRAYAIPVLTVLTALCLVDVANGATGGLPLPFGADADRQADRAAAPIPSAPPPGTGTTGSPAATPTAIYVDDPGTSARALPPAALPAGAPYAKTGGDRFDVVKGSSAASGPGPVKRYQVELEAGVAADGPAFAAAVQKTLADRRSWGGKGAMAFQRVDSGPIDFRVSLTSSLTVRKLCGYTLPFETSCYNGELGRAVINDARWVRGAVAYSGDLAAYRVYVINHEVGHALGNGHQPCRKAGTLAPVMMQQTLGLTTPGVGDCKPNPWPYP
ncbi:MAG TPA: DUF3152 domain-containing protein, partial [Mycobacteriales bacterium]